MIVKGEGDKSGMVWWRYKRKESENQRRKKEKQRDNSLVKMEN